MKGERIDPLEVFARDDWTCHICRRPVDRTAPPRSSASPSIDHVVPLSRGGAHTLNNVRCAHYGCNSGKCDRILEAV
jgi:5-methylcytosine-specific restriction endonuclease McrA